MTEETLFELALNAPAADRSALLDRECADNPELRTRVEQLLTAYEQLDASFLHNPAKLGDATLSLQLGGPGAIGTVLAGKYKLVSEIGEGGMGTVYLAQQTEPVRRNVAVKVIKAGMDSRAVLARFDAERQALAMMDHPSISRVLDAGATESGRPFFVMELVKGTPITKFCDERRLTPRQRLELFVPVCQAIQHAHQKGIIHRDIKPSNVLVALYDDQPVPKVIDFGMAKATGSPLTDYSTNTSFGAVVGTPEYMSPEQASLNNLDIDTRSDVYALGVLLYELLTGTTPVDRKSLKKAALLEVLRIVREAESPRPSAKLSIIDTLPSIAAQRSTEPSKLSKLLQGELDWVVMKALEKDRSRRYDSANALSRDVQRYLSDEIVEARPPSARYRIKKFVRRHKLEVVAAGLLLLALVAGIIGTSAGLVRANQERDRADLARAAEAERAEGERIAKEAQKVANEQAHKRLKQVEKGNEILAGIFAELDIRRIRNDDQRLEEFLAERLTRASDQLEGESVGDPAAVAALQHQLADSLLGLGFAPDAARLFGKAVATRRTELGPDDVNTLQSANELALSYQATGQLPKALPLFQETLRRRRDQLGDNHHDTLESMNNLGIAFQEIGKYSEAIKLLDETFERSKKKLGLDAADTLLCMNNLAVAYQEAGQPDRALPIFKQVLDRTQNKVGPEHPDTLLCMNTLGACYRVLGQPDKALPLIEETLKRATAKLGSAHPSTLACTNNLALAYRAAGQTDKALPLFEETLRIRREKLGAGHPDTLQSMNNLALVYQNLGQLDKAVTLFEQTLERTKKALGPDHPHTLQCATNLAKAYLASQLSEKALPLIEILVTAKRSSLGQSTPEFVNLLRQISLDLLKVRQFVAAETYLKEAFDVCKTAQPGGWITFNIQSMLGASLCGQNKFADAEPLLLKGYEGLKERESIIPSQARAVLPAAADRLVGLYAAANKPLEVKKWQTERAKYDRDPKSAEKK